MNILGLNNANFGMSWAKKSYPCKHRPNYDARQDTHLIKELDRLKTPVERREAIELIAYLEDNSPRHTLDYTGRTLRAQTDDRFSQDFSVSDGIFFPKSILTKLKTMKKNIDADNLEYQRLMGLSNEIAATSRKA